MIRSADIIINHPSPGPGALFRARVLQRSFLGINWQYRVTLENAPNMALEVWDTQEIALSQIIQLWLPADRCRAVGNITDNLQVIGF